VTTKVEEELLESKVSDEHLSGSEMVDVLKHPDGPRLRSSIETADRFNSLLRFRFFLGGGTGATCLSGTTSVAVLQPSDDASVTSVGALIVRRSLLLEHQT
jgi:hypothetical protein